ncbi:hypothetical protein G4B88_023327, partial [Cannabis sativa]
SRAEERTKVYDNQAIHESTLVCVWQPRKQVKRDSVKATTATTDLLVESRSSYDCLVGLECLLDIVRALGMGSCLSVEGASAGAGGLLPYGSASPSSPGGRRRDRRKIRRTISSNSSSSASPSSPYSTIDSHIEKRLHRVPGRICLNGCSDVTSLFTKQGQKGVNQDATIVWEVFSAISFIFSDIILRVLESLMEMGVCSSAPFMIHGLRIKDGKATYVSRYVRTSRIKQEEYFGGSKFMKIGDLKGFFGLLMVNMQMLRAKLKVLDLSYGNGTANTALIYHHGKLLALSEADKPCVLKVLEDGDLQTLGLLDYDKRLTHLFTAHPKVDPFTGEMFTFGYAHTPPYITYRVISKDGFMHEPVPITVSDPIMMHDFAITENYAIFMDLPLIFKPKVRFGVLPRYAKDELLIKWFELPNCFIFHNGAHSSLSTFYVCLYEMRFNMKTGLATQKQLSASAVDFPRVNESYTGRKSAVHVIDAKTMSSDPVAVVDLPHRVPYAFHAFFVTEVF